MSDYSFAGLPIERGDLVIPLIGAWTCDAYFSDSDAMASVGLGGDLSVLGTLRRGTITRAAGDGGFVRARIVGGEGKLGAVLPPQDYRGYTAGQIASQSIQEAGEVLGDGWDQWTTSCPHWTRPQTTLRDVLRRLARLTDDSAGNPTATGVLNWGVVRSGKLALLVRTWPANETCVGTEGYSWPQERAIQFWPADGTLSPGQSVTLFGAAAKVVRCQYRWGQEVTCRVWY